MSKNLPKGQPQWNDNRENEGCKLQRKGVVLSHESNYHQPETCGGRPCIRGMRIRVSDVLDLLAHGLTPQQVIEELSDLEVEDVQACLEYASRKINHPVLASP